MRERKAIKVLMLLPVLAVAIAVAACGSSSSGTTTTTTTLASAGSSTTTPAMMTLKVALIAPSATNDLAFTQSMYSALESLKSSDHLQIAVSANEFVVSDAANIMRQYAQEGYNLIIAHGSQYGSTVEQLAPQFPKVSFAWGTAGATFGLPNVFAYEASSNEGGYVQGYMAAMISKSKKLGIIGPIAVGDAKLYVDGFQAGAAAAAAANHFSVSDTPVYTGSFSDDSLMATAAKTFVSDGADVLTGSSQSVVGAIGVVSADKLAWFSTQWSQATLAPHNVVSSQVYNWVPVLTQIITAIRSGKLGGATYVIGLGNGGEKIVFNPGYPLPAAVKAQATKLITAITDGTITVPQ
jgi:basic membrane lipoprotein Med (substrate-binding protein (PBP1-ABC) superfamily)